MANNYFCKPKDHLKKYDCANFAMKLVSDFNIFLILQHALFLRTQIELK